MLRHYLKQCSLLENIVSRKETLKRYLEQLSLVKNNQWFHTTKR